MIQARWDEPQPCDVCDRLCDELELEKVGTRWLCEYCICDEDADRMAGLPEPEYADLDEGADFGA